MRVSFLVPALAIALIASTPPPRSTEAPAVAAAPLSPALQMRVDSAPSLAVFEMARSLSIVAPLTPESVDASFAVMIAEHYVRTHTMNPRAGTLTSRHYRSTRRSRSRADSIHAQLAPLSVKGGRGFL